MQKKKRIGLLTVLCVVFVLLTACSSGEKSPVVTCDGYDVIIGKTTIADLKAAGFTNYYSDSETVDGMSSDTFHPMKDTLSYGMMYVRNDKSSPIAYDNCIVREIVISYEDSDVSLGEVLINGVNFEGFTKEEVKDAMKDLEISLDSDEFLVYRVGEYDYTFRFLDGSETITGFDVMKLLKQPK